MVSRAEEEPRDPFLSKPLEERLIVRDDDRAIRSRKVQQGVIGGTRRVDHTISARQPQAGTGLPIPLGQKFQFGEDRFRDGDIGVPQQSLDLPVEVHAELEGHQERIRVEQDEPRQRLRPSMPAYFEVRYKSTVRVYVN